MKFKITLISLALFGALIFVQNANADQAPILIIPEFEVPVDLEPIPEVCDRCDAYKEGEDKGHCIKEDVLCKLPKNKLGKCTTMTLPNNKDFAFCMCREIESKPGY